MILRKYYLKASLGHLDAHDEDECVYRGGEVNYRISAVIWSLI